MDFKEEGNDRVDVNDKESRDEGKQPRPPPLMALNHVSRLCRNVKQSVDFYTKVLGFVLIERPQAFDFDGAWLFNYGVGIHLVQAKDEERLPSDRDHLDPMDNHISFQCADMEAIEEKLKERSIKYVKRTVDDEGRVRIDQLFFNDPDGFMIEICNCENLKLVPMGSLGKIKLPFDRHNPPLDLEQN
ncbi:hypothetical protein HS088_TW14G00616 [Tripterygium wilfordii]|uniref:VOC domain-containing protein n=1 Tax=Tripterygium wilfordii TaxID=458696 RepID=A0A7J7CQT6_TRIWF|nr:lactoylglutathione lyase [Tripterygium wilfordii]KAF5736473.1 hypothetical protein HS088_TW14G00616 [Tripterygium wilfordii]